MKEWLAPLAFLVITLVLGCGLIPSLLLYRDELREERRKERGTP